MSFVASSDSMSTMVVMPPRSGNVLAVGHPAREIYHLPTSPKFMRPGTAGVTRKRQQPIQNIMAEKMRVSTKRKLNLVANDLEAMARSDTMKRVEVCIRADDVYVREFRVSNQR